MLIEYVYKDVTSTKNTYAYKNNKKLYQKPCFKNAKIHHYVVYIDVCKISKNHTTMMKYITNRATQGGGGSFKDRKV